MPLPLLRQKLALPPSWGEFVARPRLADVLDLALTAGQHVALFAGSGYGKTTLVADWCRDRPCAWVSLDAEDAALDVFLAYVIGAVERALPGFGTEASSLLGRAQEREGAFAALSALLADLDEQVEEPLPLVLDDYHLAASPSLDALVARMLKYLPAQVRLVLIARRQPAVELAALQARRAVIVLDEAQLSFDEAELGQLRPDLDAPQLTALRGATGGWPAAMGMSAGLLDAYLDEQVLVAQPADVRALLMRLALVDAFDAALCEEALDEPLTQDRRAWLLSHRLMLPVADGASDRWALPPLLRDLLRRRFATEVPREARRAIFRRIGDWYFRHGQPSTALRSWVEAGEIAMAAERLEAVAEDWLVAGRQEALAGALAALAGAGEDGRREAARPALLLAQGELHRRWGDFERTEQLLADAVQGFSAAPSAESAAGRALARLRQAQTAASRGQVVVARERLAEARPGLIQHPRHQLDVLIVEGGLALLDDDTATAIARYETALRLSRELGDRYAEARAIHNLGVCYTRLGEFRQALASYDAALARPLEGGTPAVWMTPINRALVLIYLGRPADGREAAAEALSMARRFRLTREEGYALRILGFAHQRLGDLDAAQVAYEAAELLARRADDTLGLAYSLNFQAERAALAGDVEGARRLAEEVETRMGGPERVVAISEFAAVRARIKIAEGRVDEASKLIDQLAARARTHGYKHLLSETAALATELAARRAGAAEALPAPVVSPILAAVTASPPELAIRCFGGLRVARADAEIGEREWQTARAKHLLGYLLHAPEGATKPALFEAIYPQEDVTDASMNMTLMRLRKALEPKLEKGQPSRFVLRADGRYAFNWQARVEVDTQAFDQVLRAARLAKGPDEEATHLERALALYRGEFLPECDQAWAIALRQRYLSRVTDACRRLLAIYDERRPAAIPELLHRALEIDPVSEDLNRELILRYLEAGEGPRAQAHFKLVERRWRELLDAPPPADLAALVAGA